MSSLDKWEPIAKEYNPLKAGSIDGTDTVPHDHGIVCAMAAVYKPNKLVAGDPKATIFVGQLNPKTSEDSLGKAFSRCGEIKRLRLVRDVVTGFSKGYAFIEYYDRYNAIEAQNSLHRTVIDEKEILVDAECERTLSGWIPRRLGGGLSGKKESGQLRFGGKVRPFKKPILIKDFNRNHRERDNDYDRSNYSKYNLNDRYSGRSRDWSYSRDRENRK